MRVLTALTAGLLFTAGLFGDTLQLRNGQQVQGTLIRVNQSGIRFQSDRGTTTYNLSDVDAIYFGQYSPAARSYNNGRYDEHDRDRDRYNSNSSNNEHYYGSSDRSNNYRPGDRTSNDSQNARIPAGTVIPVRTIDRIDSDTAHSGDTFRASVSQPVVVNGQTVIPQGADATLRVVGVEQGGRITGNEQVTLDLDSIHWSGNTLTLNTTNAQLSNGSRGKQSAEVIGGGAALGAIIGAIAGGGQGAAIGAATGAGAGTAVQMVRGQHLKIQPETEINFTVGNDTYIR